MDLLTPLNYSDSISYHGEKIDAIVYNDDKNNFKLFLNCFKSYGDTIDYYEIELTLINLSKDRITIDLSKIRIYTEDYLLIPDEITEKRMIVGAYHSTYRKVEPVFINDSLRYFIRFPFYEETNSYESILNEKQADLVVTNIDLEKEDRQISVPKFYFKE
ncbi:MAG: hypothetical protein P8X47_11750 [Ignavibacteriaceae bacterium]